MSSVPTKKTFIQLDTSGNQQEHLLLQRKTLKVRQVTNTDKENKRADSPPDKLNRIKIGSDITLATAQCPKRYKGETRDAAIQTTPQVNLVEKSESTGKVTASDLTGDSPPSAAYWQALAEKRYRALKKTIEENHRLHQQVRNLGKELDASRNQFAEVRMLLDILQEMVDGDATLVVGEALSEDSSGSADDAGGNSGEQDDANTVEFVKVYEEEDEADEQHEDGGKEEDGEHAQDVDDGTEEDYDGGTEEYDGSAEEDDGGFEEDYYDGTEDEHDAEQHEEAEKLDAKI